MRIQINLSHIKCIIRAKYIEFWMFFCSVFCVTIADADAETKLKHSTICWLVSKLNQNKTYTHECWKWQFPTHVWMEVTWLPVGTLTGGDLHCCIKKGWVTSTLKLIDYDSHFYMITRDSLHHRADLHPINCLVFYDTSHGKPRKCVFTSLNTEK